MMAFDEDSRVFSLAPTPSATLQIPAISTWHLLDGSILPGLGGALLFPRQALPCAGWAHTEQGGS